MNLHASPHHRGSLHQQAHGQRGVLHTAERLAGGLGTRAYRQWRSSSNHFDEKDRASSPCLVRFMSPSSLVRSQEQRSDL